MQYDTVRSLTLVLRNELLDIAWEYMIQKDCAVIFILDGILDELLGF